jgi:soluble lytic murein transglycosylase-like protein
VLRFFIVLFVSCAVASPAAAQIYTWRDASGTLVVSNKPRRDAGEMTTYAVAGASAFRATQQAQAPARARQFDGIIEEHARAYGVPADLVRAVIQAESAFDPNAVSPKGAMGLMQLMPATARELGVRNPFHPEENIRGGVTYLAQLLARYSRNVELALAAYNAGPTNVERYGNAVPPFRETREYVRKITAKAATSTSVPSEPVVYKWTEMIDGKALVRYSNKRPTQGQTYEVIGRR